jgi:ribosomal protein S12 methylthiotransferase accessory factor YcaO
VALRSLERARSNGVALHEGWAAACERAYWELVERDRVLRAWWGETSPAALAIAEDSPLARLPSYEVKLCTFPGVSTAAWGAGIEVAGVIGFPLRADVPLFLGYAGRPSLLDAVEAATREAIQLLAFLWGESIPTEPPSRAPGPMMHLDHHLFPGNHAALRRWLEGDHRQYSSGLPEAFRSRQVEEDSLGFVDLTPRWMRGLRVAKAISPHAALLTFGEAPSVAHLPDPLRIHPIA